MPKEHILHDKVVGKVMYKAIILQQSKTQSLVTLDTACYYTTLVLFIFKHMSDLKIVLQNKVPRSLEKWEDPPRRQIMSPSMHDLTRDV